MYLYVIQCVTREGITPNIHSVENISLKRVTQYNVVEDYFTIHVESSDISRNLPRFSGNSFMRTDKWLINHEQPTIWSLT